MFGKQNKFGQWSGRDDVPGGRPFLQMPGVSGARLTATPGTPVTTADVTGGTTLSLTAYTSDRLTLMSEWGEWRAFRLPQTPAGVPERTYSFLASSPWALVNATPYDIFAFVGADGFVDIERGPAWSSGTARAAALARLDGANVLGINPTRLYVGTIYASVTNTVDDSYGGTHQAGGKRFVWNAFNRVKRHLGVISTTTSYNYSSTAWRQLEGATGNRVEYVCGLATESIRALAKNLTSGSTGQNAACGVGIDSTSANSAIFWGNSLISTSAQIQMAEYVGNPGIGYHAINWLERTDGVGTTTWWCTAGGAFQSGFVAEVWM